MSKYLSFISNMGLFISVIAGVSSSSFLLTWLIMEINLLLFISLMMLQFNEMKNTQIKYFMIQSVGSSMMLFSLIVFSKSIFMGFLFYISLALKLALAPFHFWLLDFMKESSIMSSCLILTLQKVIPFYMLSYVSSAKLISVFIVINMFTGIMGGMLEQSWKMVMTYSSIFGNAWMMLVWNSLNILFTFLFVYAIPVYLIFFSMNKSSNFTEKDWIYTYNFNLSATLLISFLSLMGFPPLWGFWVKIYLIKASLFMNNISVILMFTVIIFSVVFFYIYLRLCYFGAMTSLEKFLISNQKSMMNVFLLILIFTPIPFFVI